MIFEVSLSMTYQGQELLVPAALSRRWPGSAARIQDGTMGARSKYSTDLDFATSSIGRMTSITTATRSIINQFTMSCSLPTKRVSSGTS